MSVLQVLRDLRQRVWSVFGRGEVLSSAESNGRCTLQVRVAGGRIVGAADQFAPWGLDSRPLPNCEAAIAGKNGSLDAAVVLGVIERRFRPADLNPGDVALHNSAGDTVRINHDRTLHARVNGAELEMSASGILLRVGSSELEITSAGVRIKGAAVDFEQ